MPIVILNSEHNGMHLQQHFIQSYKFVTK